MQRGQARTQQDFEWVDFTSFRNFENIHKRKIKLVPEFGEITTDNAKVKLLLFRNQFLEALKEDSTLKEYHGVFVKYSQEIENSTKWENSLKKEVTSMKESNDRLYKLVCLLAQLMTPQAYNGKSFPEGEVELFPTDMPAEQFFAEQLEVVDSNVIYIAEGPTDIDQGELNRYLENSDWTAKRCGPSEWLLVRNGFDTQDLEMMSVHTGKKDSITGIFDGKQLDGKTSFVIGGDFNQLAQDLVEESTLHDIIQHDVSIEEELHEAYPSYHFQVVSSPFGIEKSLQSCFNDQPYKCGIAPQNDGMKLIFAWPVGTTPAIIRQILTDLDAKRIRHQ